MSQESALVSLGQNAKSPPSATAHGIMLLWPLLHVVGPQEGERMKLNQAEPDWVSLMPTF